MLGKLCLEDRAVISPPALSVLSVWGDLPLLQKASRGYRLREIPKVRFRDYRDLNASMAALENPHQPGNARKNLTFGLGLYNRAWRKIRDNK